jgi:hypothetical protein
VRQQAVHLRLQALGLRRGVVLDRGDLQSLLVEPGIGQFIGPRQSVGLIERTLEQLQTF